MSTEYESWGRTRQKGVTRAALVDAARDLIARGTTPTVEEAAKAAAISRTTAYRYFPTQAALLTAAHPEIAKESLLPRGAPQDPGERLALVVDRFIRLTLRTEREHRTMLRLSLEAGADKKALPLRQGRAIKWLEEALAPLEARLGRARARRLVLAIRSAVGIEALVWLTDVAGLSRNEAAEVMRWSARALFRGALEETRSR